MEAAVLFVPHLSHTHTHLYKHIFSLWRRQLQRALTNLLFRLLTLFQFFCYFNLFFFFISHFVFASILPRAFYYTAKVTFMSPQCLKPNAPVCQEGTDV